MLLWESYSWCSSWLDFYICLGDFGSIYFSSFPCILKRSFSGKCFHELALLCNSTYDTNLTIFFLLIKKKKKLNYIFLFRFYINFWITLANLIGKTTASAWMVQSAYPHCPTSWVSNIFLLAWHTFWFRCLLVIVWSFLQLRHLKMMAVIYCSVMIFSRDV